MHFKPNFHTPNKRISKLDGINRPPSFVETPNPAKEKKSYSTPTGEDRGTPDAMLAEEKEEASCQNQIDDKVNKLEQVESLDGAGGSGAAKHVTATKEITEPAETEHMGGGTSSDILRNGE